MTLIQVAVGYIQENRGIASDADIRSSLAARGFSPDLLDQAFSAAGPRPASATPPPPAADSAPPAAAKSRLGFWLAGGLGGAVALGLAGAIALGIGGGSKKRKPQPTLPPELANHRPTPLADPPDLPMFLPAEAVDGDAAADYLAMLDTTGGFLDARRGSPVPAPTDAQIALLESALRKKRSTFAIGIARPGTKASNAALILKVRMLQSLSAHLKSRYDAAKERGDWAEADREARKLILLGWHNAQDWDFPVQSLGVTTMLGALLTCTVAADNLGKRDAAFRIASGRAALDLAAYAPDKASLDDIQEVAADPERLSGLMSKLAEPAQRRAYASTIILAIASRWSEAEAVEGRPAPSREAFFRQAAAIDDPSLRIFAAHGEAMLGEVVEHVATIPRDERAAALEETKRRLAR